MPIICTCNECGKEIFQHLPLEAKLSVTVHELERFCYCDVCLSTMDIEYENINGMEMIVDIQKKRT